MTIRLLILGMIILNYQTSCGVGNKDSLRRVEKDYHTNLLIYAGSSLALSSESFFNDYQKYLSRNIREFKVTPVVSASIKFDLDTGYRACISVDYFRASFNDSFQDSVRAFSSLMYRSIYEKFVIDNYPVIFSVEYHPVNTPYKTFLAFGAGIIISKILWEESVSSPKEDDSRDGGIQFDKTILSPALRLTSGLELNFDRKTDRDFLKSLVAEARFNYLFRYVSIFKGLEAEDTKFKPIAAQSYAILPFYIGLYLGLSFNIGYL